MGYIDTVLHPERYHGFDKKPPFFEGWYFKVVSADRSARYAIIPGIFLSDDPARHHAFVQVFDGISGRATYHRYPADAFRAARDRFAVSIGDNHFALDRVQLAIDDDLRQVRADLRFGTTRGWPVRLTEPGVMGWFGWMPFMECYHGILGFDHTVSGMLVDDSVGIDFKGGRGYIEKDWGKSFPGGWVWMQSNHFEREGISLTASVAITPFAGRWFPGFLAGVMVDGDFHRFATYTGAKTEKLEVTDDHVLWVVRGGGKRLEINATRAEASLLPGPNRSDMGERVPETLKASIDVCLTSLSGGAPIVMGRGECAGLEVAGDIDRLLKAI